MPVINSPDVLLPDNDDPRPRPPPVPERACLIPWATAACGRTKASEEARFLLRTAPLPSSETHLLVDRPVWMAAPGVRDTEPFKATVSGFML